MHRLLISAVGFLGLMPFLAGQSPAQRAPRPLFFPTSAATSIREDPSRAVWQRVDLDRALLEQPGPQQPLLVDLLGEQSIRFVPTGKIPASAGGYLVPCTIPGDDHSFAVFSVKGEAVSASIRVGTTAYTLQPITLSSGTRGISVGHVLSRVDPARTKPCGGAAEVSLNDLGGTGGALALTSGDCTLDLLMAYTPDAAAAYGGADGMVSLINLAVHDTNLAFAQSDVDLRTQAVRIHEVSYAESGDDLQYLYDLQGTVDGNMDEIHAIRDECGADAVVLLYATGNYGGIAYFQPCLPLTAYASSAFCVVGAGGAAGPSYVLAHELGHLLGADHARVDVNNPCQLTPSSFGWKTSLTRTVMAYSPGIRLPFFSNPDKLDPFNDEPLGVSGSEENWDTLNQYAGVATSYRPARDTGYELTTLFDSDGTSQGNMFDIIPSVDLELTGMDINVTNLFLTAQVDVWYRVGSYQGHENSAAGWMLLAAGSGISLGVDLPTSIDLDTDRSLRAGQTYGIFVDLESTVSMDMNDSQGSSEEFTNDHLYLKSGVGKSGGFTSATLPGRVWNGTLRVRPAAGGQSLSTRYTGLKTRGGLMFDVDPHRALTINSFDVNIDDSSAPGRATVDVWYRLGSHVGVEDDPHAWFFLGTDDKVQCAGPGQATRVAVGGLTLDPAFPYAFYLHLGSHELGHRFLCSVGSQSATSGDLTIFAGTSKGIDAFTSNNVPNRIWNGAIHSTRVPWVDLGSELGDGVFTPRLTGTGTMLPGSTPRISLLGAPARNLAFLILGSSRWDAPFGGGTLVPSLDSIVSLRTTLLGTLMLSGELPQTLPQGYSFVAQYWLPRGGGWLASNALQLTVQ